MRITSTLRQYEVLILKSENKTRINPEDSRFSIDTRWPKWISGIFNGKLYYVNYNKDEGDNLPKYNRSRIFNTENTSLIWSFDRAKDKNVLFVKIQGEIVGEIYLKRRFFNIIDVIKSNYWAECYFYVKFYDDPLINDWEFKSPYGRTIRPEIEQELMVSYDKKKGFLKLSRGTFSISLIKK